MQFIPERLETYLYWIKERELIRYRKEELKEEPPWTEDEILKQFKFCQVFREDDRTTRWFREHIRDPLKDSPDVVMAIYWLSVMIPARFCNNNVSSVIIMVLL
jgi:hypothetical protein